MEGSWVSLSLEFPDSILAICRVIASSGNEAYLVGGCVRDGLLGRKIFDYDIATSALPEVVSSLFEFSVPTGIHHGTVTVFHGGISCEVTTFRREDPYLDNRRPSMVYFDSSLEEDLSRRDFTINAFAYDPKEKKFLDLFGGLSDLEKKRICSVGSPKERFQEDALRMLRACRFSSQLNFDIEGKTFSAIKELKSNVQNLSKERIREEFCKIILSRNPLKGIEILRESGLLEEILPRFAETFGFTQNKYHAYDLYRHSLETLKNIEKKDLILRLAAVFHDLGKLETRSFKEDGEASFYNHEIVGAKMVEKILKDLKFSKDQIEKVCHFIHLHMIHYTVDWSDGAIRRFVLKLGEENLEDWFLLRYADRLGTGKQEKTDKDLEEFKSRIEKILQEQTKLKLTDLEVNGDILIEELGIKPSKKLGNLLKYLHEKILDNPSLNKKEVLLQMAKEVEQEISNF